MSDLFNALKADLLSRRMLPLVALAVVALAGALAYVALAGKASGEAPVKSVAQTPEAASLPGPAVASAPANPNAAVSETTFGAGFQHEGKMRNPFTPLVAPKSKESTKSTTSSSTSGSSGSGSSSGGSSSSSQGGSGSSGSSGSGSGSGGSGSGSGSGGSGSSGAITLFHVDVVLQQLNEEGKPSGEPQTFEDVTHLQPLPSKRKGLIAPEGVTGNGTGVAFLLLHEAILHGGATCVPNPGDCQAIDLRLHKSEELQFPQNDGSMLFYKLTVTKIEKIGTTASTAKAAAVHTSVAGKALIARMHLSVPTSSAFKSELGTIVGAIHK